MIKFQYYYHCAKYDCNLSEDKGSPRRTEEYKEENKCLFRFEVADAAIKSDTVFNDYQQLLLNMTDDQAVEISKQYNVSVYCVNIMREQAKCGRLKIYFQN